MCPLLRFVTLFLDPKVPINFGGFCFPQIPHSCKAGSGFYTTGQLGLPPRRLSAARRYLRKFTGINALQVKIIID